MEQFVSNFGLLLEFPVVNLKIVLDGIMIGALFALAAYGLALVWGVMNVKNLAQGDFVIGGGYICWWLTQMGVRAGHRGRDSRSQCIWASRAAGEDRRARCQPRLAGGEKGYVDESLDSARGETAAAGCVASLPKYLTYYTRVVERGIFIAIRTTVLDLIRPGAGTVCRYDRSACVCARGARRRRPPAGIRVLCGDPSSVDSDSVL